MLERGRGAATEFLSGRTRTSSGQQRERAHLVLERLEDRVVPATQNTATALVSSVASPVLGQAVTFTASVGTNSNAYLSSGLTASYYNLNTSPPGLATAFLLPSGKPTPDATLVATRTDAQVNVPDSSNGFVPTVAVHGLGTDSVAASWSGAVQITTAGTYTFYSKSDDASNLYIDGNLAVANDGQHSFTDGASTTMTLSGGYHTFLEVYDHGGAGGGAVVSYQGPDTSNVRTTIPSSVFFQSSALPTGTVTFYDNGNSLGTGTLSSSAGTSQATFTTNGLTLGSHTITAAYTSGDSKYSASSASPGTVLTVGQAGTQTAVTADHNPSLSGQSVNFTATVGGIAPGLAASFYNLSSTPAGVGSAFSVPGGTPTGIATLVASRTDAQINVTDTTGFLPNPAVAGLNVNNVAAKWSGFVNISTAGTYTFYSPSGDGTLLYIDGHQVVNNDLQHTFVDGTSTPVTLTAGLHSFMELYEQGNGPAGVRVDYSGPDTGNTRTTIPAGAFFYSTAGAAPTGTVQFVIDGSNYGSPVTLSGGAASISDSALSPGTHTVSAVYNGNTNYLGSNANATPLGQAVLLPGLPIEYADFSSTSGLTLNENTTRSMQSGNALRLTDSGGNEAGSAFSGTQISLGQSFTTHFQFSMHDSVSNPAADGITFTIQNSTSGTKALGSNGGSLGYAGIAPSLAVEFDIWNNGTTDSNNANHVAILTGGNINDAVLTIPNFFMYGNGPVNAWIDYNATTTTLSVYVSQFTAKPATALLTYNYNLASNIGSTAYVGFTAGTGAANAFQDIQNWQLAYVVPSVTSLGQTSALEGSQSITLTVNGANFASDSVVKWNGTALTTTPVSASQLQAIVPAADLAEEGSDSVTVFNPLGGTSNVQTFSISDQQLTNLAAANLPSTGQEGVALGAVTGIATFTDPAGVGNETTNDFTATVNWGDNMTSPGTVVSLGGGNYRIDAPSHTYNEEGTYTVNVTLKHDALAALTTANQSIAVGDFTPTVNAGSNTTVALTPVLSSSGSFVDASADTWTATVNYGDNTGTQTLALSGHTFSLNHTYTADGQYTVTVKVTDDEGTVGTGTFVATVTAFTVMNTNATGANSLYQAITNANNTTGTQTIHFNIPTSDPGYNSSTKTFTISATTALPTVSDTVVIDGTSQPGYAGAPLVVVNGGSAGSNVNGLTITASNSTVQGLVIGNFTGNGIVIDGSTGGGSGDVIQNVYVGTTGAAALGNAGNGIVIQAGASGNTIGGSTAAARDLISGNGGNGVVVTGAGSGNVIQGDYIGTDSTGLTALRNLGSYDLTATSYTGSLTVTGTIASGAVNVSAGVSTTLTMSADSVGSLAATPGTTHLAGTIATTSGSAAFTGPVVLDADANITSAGSITFNGTVDGANNLTLSGTTAFNGSVGTTALASLSVSGATTVNAAAITTTGAQSYTGAVTLTHDAALKGGSIIFNSTVDGAQNLTATGSTSFNGTVGGGTALASLSVTGTTTVNAAAITTTGAQSYNGAATLTHDAAFTSTGSGSIAFGGTLDGSQNLTVTAGTGNVSFTGAVGSGARLNTVTVVSAGNVTVSAGMKATALTQNAGSGTTALGGTVDVNGAAGVSLTTSAISLTGSVTVGAGSLTWTAANSVTESSGASVSAGGNLTLTATAGNISLGSMSAPGHTVILSASGAITDATAGAGTNVTALNLAMTAGGGIGTANDPLATAVSNLGASGGTGGVYLSNTGALNITTVNGVAGVSATGGNIAVTTHSPLTVNYAVSDTGGGNVNLTAGASTPNNDNLTLNAAVTSSGGNGNVTLIANNNVYQNAGGNVSAAGAGVVTVTATTGAIAMDPTATTTSGSGAVNYSAGTSITVGAISTGTSSANVGLSAAAGSITASNVTGTNVTAFGVSLVASAGVGLPSKPIETKVSSLAGNGGNGGFYVDNQGGVAISTVNGVIGVTASGGDISVTTHSPVTVNQPVTNTGNGKIVLSADTTTSNSSITVNAPISTSGGDVTETANNIAVASSATISTGGSSSANVNLQANNNLSVNGQVQTGNVNFQASTGTLAVASGSVSAAGTTSLVGAQFNANLSGASLGQAAFNSTGSNSVLNLSNSSFKGAVFSGANFGTVNLNGAKFNGAAFNPDISGAGFAVDVNGSAFAMDLSSSKFSGAVFNGSGFNIDLGGSAFNPDLSGSKFGGAIFTGGNDTVKLGGASFSGSGFANDLTGSVFNGAFFNGSGFTVDLSGANFKLSGSAFSTDLSGSVFSGAAFKGSDFSVDLGGAAFLTDLSGSVFSGDLSGTVFSGAVFDTDISGAGFAADLTGASFENDLNGSTFTGAHGLTGSIFSGALFTTDLGGAAFNGTASFGSANFHNATFINDLGGSSFKNGGLGGSVFSGAQFNYAAFPGLTNSGFLDDLSGATFDNNLSHAGFAGDLGGTVFSGAAFDMNLAGFAKNLSGSAFVDDLAGAAFSNDLSYSNFTGSLTGSITSGSAFTDDLTGAKFSSSGFLVDASGATFDNNLSHAGFAGDLGGSVFTGAQFNVQAAGFAGDIEGATFTDPSGTTFTNAAFADDLSGATFTNDLSNSSFTSGGLIGSITSGAAFTNDLTGASFTNAAFVDDLSGAKFSNKLHNTNWKGGLNGSVFTGATFNVQMSGLTDGVNGSAFVDDLAGASFTDDLSGATFTGGLQGTVTSGAAFADDISNAGFGTISVNLTGATFSSDLSNSSFIGDLGGSVFIGVQFQGSGFSVDLTDASFNAILTNDHFTGGLTGSLVIEALFSGNNFNVNLTGTTFTNILSGAIFVNGISGTDFSGAYFSGSNFNIYALPGGVPANTPSVSVKGLVAVGSNFDISLPNASIGSGNFGIDMPNGQLKNLDGAIFSAAPGSGYFQVNLSGATFDGAVFVGPYANDPNKTGRDYGLPTIDLAASKFDFGYFLASGTSTAVTSIGASGAQFGTVVNYSQGTYTSFDLSNTSFYQPSGGAGQTGAVFVIPGFSQTNFDLSSNGDPNAGQTLTNIVNLANNVSAINLNGAVFGSLTNYGNSVSNITAVGSTTAPVDFQVIDNEGNNVNGITVSGVNGDAHTLINNGSNVTGINYVGGTGPDVFVNNGNNVTAAWTAGTGANDTAEINGSGLNFSLTGSGGNDNYAFESNPAGSVAITEPYSTAAGGAKGVSTLDFSNFKSGGINIDLAKVGPQTVYGSGAQALTLNLQDGTNSTTTGEMGITNVIGTQFSDTMYGNGRNDFLQGAAFATSDIVPPQTIAPPALATSDVANPAANLGTVSGTVSLQLGTVTVNVTPVVTTTTKTVSFNPSTTSLNGLASLINGAGAGLTATVAADGMSGLYRLLVTSNTAGTVPTITVTAGSSPLTFDTLADTQALGSAWNGVTQVVLLDFDSYTNREPYGDPNYVPLPNGGAENTNNAVQTITVNATGGTFTVSFGNATTGPLSYKISAQDLQTALQGLSSIGSNNVLVAQPQGEPGIYVLSFRNALGNKNLAPVTTNSSGLTGGTSTAQVATIVQGGGAAEHVYSLLERQAIAAQIAQDYSGFPIDVVFSTALDSSGNELTDTGSDPLDAQLARDRAVANAASVNTGGQGQYATVYYNASRRVVGAEGTPIDPVLSPNGNVLLDLEPGGDSNQVDFLNQSLGGIATAQINGLLGGAAADQADPTFSDYVIGSSYLGAHEFGHLGGQRHADAFGPPGNGVNDPPGVTVYNPTYPGPAAAFETNSHIMASPASTGFTFNSDTSNFVTPAYFGERNLIKLSMDYAINETAQTPAPGAANTQVLVNELSATHQGTVQPLALIGIPVPNTMPHGVNAGKNFAVGALTVLGSVNSGTDTATYSLQLSAGDLLNLEAISNGLIQPPGSGYVTNPINPVLSVYDSGGHLVAYFTGTATNQGQFETNDASIIDLRITTTGTYYVEVSAPSFVPTTANPSGQYELYVYRFEAYSATTGNDTLIGRGGNTTFQAGPGSNTITGGTGTNTVIAKADANFSLTKSQLTFGQGTDSLTNVQNAVLIGGPGNNTFTVDPTWTGALTINGNGGNDSLAATGTLAVSSTTVKGNLAAATIAGDLLNTFTVGGTLGNLTVGGGNGIKVTVTAADISGNVQVTSGSISGTVQATGNRIDPVSGTITHDSGTFGSVFVNPSGQITGVTTVYVNSGFSGNLLSKGSLYSQVTINSGTTSGTINAGGDIGAVQTGANGYTWTNNKLSTFGGITVNGGTTSGALIKAGGSIFGDLVLNGGMAGQIVSGKDIVDNITISNGSGLTGGISDGGDLGAAQRDSSGNILNTYGTFTASGGDSGSLLVSGSGYDSITINGGLNGNGSYTTQNGANLGSFTGGQLIFYGNLVGGLTIFGGDSGLIAVQGDMGSILLDSQGKAALNGSNALTRSGSFTINGGLNGGAVVVLGNVFCDFTINGGMTAGKVAVQGKAEYGLNTNLGGNDSYTSANARIGMLGKVTINKTIDVNSTLVSGGVIGDDGFEYNPTVAAGNDTTGTMATISSLKGIVAAAEDINGSISSGGHVFEDTAYASNTQNNNAIKAIFTDGGTPLMFDKTPGDRAGLALILGDLAHLTLDTKGNLTGTVL
jgi:uncharacterized protein YjbI with pentapeptide repeats